MKYVVYVLGVDKDLYWEDGIIYCQIDTEFTVNRQHRRLPMWGFCLGLLWWPSVVPSVLVIALLFVVHVWVAF